jgi:hypothetical protein
MSEITEAYESGKAVGRCQGVRDMEAAIALGKEASFRIAQHTQAKMPSWSDVTSDIIFSTTGERDVAAEVFSRIAHHFAQLSHNSESKPCSMYPCSGILSKGCFEVVRRPCFQSK